jgi:hypothetical protein
MSFSQPQLGETTIKVSAPFAGVDDLGFTAQYRAQDFNEPLRDIPLLFEGPPPPMRRLAELLQQLSGVQAAYAWTDPVMLSDEVVVLAFQDRSLPSTLSDGRKIADYLANLVRPVVFTFLRDCVSVAHLRLAEQIEMRVSAARRSPAGITMQLRDIVQPNGERLLWS